MPDLVAGLSGETEWTVTETMTASHIGSGTVVVLATPMLVALLENAAITAFSVVPACRPRFGGVTRGSVELPTWMITRET